jgi:(hydroxyamino)benzene mutase
MNNNAIQKRLAAAGALLFFIGMLTGLWAAAALTGKVKVGIPHLALAAHLNGLIGGLWLIAVAWTLDFLHYGERGRRRLAIAVSVPAWSNWLVTLLASVLGVNGLAYTGDHANDLIAALLQTTVVLPTLIACGFWAWGFRGSRE